MKESEFCGKSGLTLMELMVTAGIIIIVLVGLLRLFTYCLNLSEIAGNLTIALSAAQGKLEEIRNHNFSSIVTDYSSGGTPGKTFALTQINGMGAIYIDNSNSELLEIEIVVSWQNKNDRIIGEDANLDGDLDVGEDKNGNGKLDSPAALVSLIAER